MGALTDTGTTIDNPKSGGRITVLESWRDNGGARVSFDRRYPAATGKAAPHYHLDFEQTFEVIAGHGKLEIEGAERSLGPGDKVEIPLETAHHDLFNDGPAERTGRVTLEPVPRFVEMYATTWFDAYSRGETNDQDEMSLLQILVIAQAWTAKASPPARRAGSSGRRCR